MTMKFWLPSYIKTWAAQPIRSLHFFHPLCLIVLLAAAIPEQVNAHVEMVASFTLEEYNGEYFIQAILEKQHLTMALTHEGKCPAAQMISVCGDRYVRAHFHVFAKTEEVILEKVSMEIEKENIVFVYKLHHSFEDVPRIKVNSDYMFAYNDHGNIRVINNLGSTPKSYTLKPDRTTAFLINQ